MQFFCCYSNAEYSNFVRGEDGVVCRCLARCYLLLLLLLLEKNLLLGDVRMEGLPSE
jgi:hypothetical protein